MQTLKRLFASMRVRIVAAVLAALVVGSIAAVTAIPALASHTAVKTPAATPTPSAACTLYIQTLAAQLHVSTSALQSANVAALDAVMNQAVKNGTITQAKATKIEQKLASDSSSPCHRIGLGAYSGARGMLHQVRTDVATAVATKLGYSDEKALHAALKGTDIVTLAKSKGVDQTTLNATITTAVQTDLATLVTKGTITSAQETQALAKVTKALSAGKYKAFGLH